MTLPLVGSWAFAMANGHSGIANCKVCSCRSKHLYWSTVWKRARTSLLEQC